MSGIEPISASRPFALTNISTALPSLPQVQTEPPPQVVPAAVFQRKKIKREYGIDVLDSDVKFSVEDVEVIGQTLEEIRKKKKQHLIGVKKIIKNQKHRLTIKKAMMVSAGGAYDADNKTVYIFDNVPPDGIPEVLTHEIGHAVSHFNLEFQKFMQFVKESGYNMQEFRRFFVPENQFHQFGTKKVKIAPDQWGSLLDRFSMKTLAKNQDIFGEIILELSRHRQAGAGRKQAPWDENPLESFSWAYEWYLNQNE
jgi:Zn-dependent peptidase ImmA (M78 family)